MNLDTKVDGFLLPNMQTWFRQGSFISTPDNGLLYHSRSDVNYISPLVPDQMPRVMILNVKGSIKALACSLDWSERREFAILDDQHNLQVWDLDQEAAVKGHRAHAFKSDRYPRGVTNEVTAAMCFTQTQKILSVENSILVVYCLLADNFKAYADLFRPADTVVLLSPAPHDRNLFAAGMKNGLIKLFRLGQSMNATLHVMRGHDSEIVSIDWMQVRVRPEQSNAGSWRSEKRPIKEARKKPEKKAEVGKPPELEAAASSAALADTSDIFDIYDYNENEEEFGTIVDKKTSSDDQKDPFYSKVHTTEGFNFLEECQNLRQDIIKAKEEQDQEEDDGDNDRTPRHEPNTDDENELDEAEKLRDYIIVDGEGKEKVGEEEDGVTRTVMLTGSRENTVFFWDPVAGISIDKIRLQNTKRLPAVFITAAWVNPGKVVTNTCSGFVHEWSVNFFYRGSQIRMAYKQNMERYPVDWVIHLIRSRAAFGNCDPKADYIWCLSMQKKFVGICATGNPEVVAELTCLATGNTRIVENPMESTILAVACIDKRLITLNLASMAYNEIHCAQFSNKIQSKVTALDWHPETENFIAYGTNEGRIGMFDTNSPNNVQIMNSFLATDVYALKWCELTDEFHQRSTVLFATGKNKMAYYKMIGPRKHDPIEVRQFGMVSSVSSSGNYLFVGTQDGYVIVADLNKNLEQLYRRSVSRRYLISMVFKDDVLAVSSNENVIRLIDFSQGMNDQVDGNMRVLEGHLNGVCCLRWGYNDSKLLVSGSFDDTVRVWDTVAATCLYVYHSADSVFCAIFSPIHENVVILTGKGTTLAFIDYTKYPASEANSVVKKVKLPVQWAVSEERGSDKRKKNDRKKGANVADSCLEKSVESLQIADKPTTNGHPEEPEQQQQPEKEPVAPKQSTTTEELDELTEQMKEVKFEEIGPIRLKANVPTIFHLTNREINKPIDMLSCIAKLAYYEEPSGDYPEHDEEPDPEKQQQPSEAPLDTDEQRYFNEKLFMAEKELRELIDEETKNHHTTRTASIGMILLPQIGLRLKEEIIQRIASKTLTDQLVALAPSISYEFWRKCCEAYAYQFLGKQYTLASIPYFLASHKITEAIDYLCKNKYFREAWAICKLRKDADDPLRQQVCLEWAQYLELTGNLEGAALIWTVAKQYKNAIAVLSKRKDITEDIQRTIDLLNARQQELAAAE